MNASQKIWAFIPKKRRHAAAQGVTRPPQGVTRPRATVYVKIKAISNTWDYTVTL